MNKHVHQWNSEPSYIIRTHGKVEKVWVCANKSSGYCLEVKREVTNA